MAKSNLKKAKYLLVDDDQMFQSIVERLAEAQGLIFKSVSSIHELGKLKNLRDYEAIFVDYDLEDGTGFQVAEVLKKNIETLPVILISATNRPYQDKLSQLPNIVGFISKWGDPKDFVAEAKRILEEKPGIAA